MTDSRGGAGKYKMSVEHHLVPESKKMLKSTLSRDMSKKIKNKSAQNSSHQLNLGQFGNQNT